MTIVTKRVCNICGKENCDGIEFITEDMYGSYGLRIGYEKVCKNHPDVKIIDGHSMYKVVSGHGDYHYFYIFPHHYTKKQIKKEAEILRKEQKKNE